MIKIEFVKGLGGVVNILNGNLRTIDRDNITDVEDVDRVQINASNFSPLGFNDSLNALQISGYIIIFVDNDAMLPYLNQIDLFDGQTFNPGVDGIQKPSWDSAGSNKTDGIQHHTYIDTDIEKDLIG